MVTTTIIPATATTDTDTDAMQTISRDDGTKLATVTSEGGRIVLTMGVPDGCVSRQSCWLLSPTETDKLVDALDREAVELNCAGR